MEGQTLSRGQALTSALAKPGYAGWLLALVLACVTYAAFANGATSIPEESRVQIALAVGILLAGVGLFSGAVGVARSPLAWAGVGLLALFTLLSALSVGWSLAPDQGWLAANRAAEYTAAVAIVLIAAPSVRRAPELALAGYLVVALAVALYALGGKLFPELSIGPIDLDHASQFSRLREPVGYWNALGLLLVMATPACVWVASDSSRPEGWRIGALLALQLLLVTIALTYSRGAVIAFLTVVAVMVAAGPAAERLRRLAVVGLAIAGAAPAVAFAFSVDSLSEDGVAAADRAGDGALLAFILAVSMLALAGAAVAALSAERRTQWGAEREARAWRALGGAALAGVLALVVALAISDRGLTGSISHQWDEFREPVEVSNDPGRLVSGSGSNRWIWWGEASGAFWDRPIAGWGAGSFPILHFAYSEHQTQARSTHSVPLEFLSENGLLGGAIAISALALLGLAAVRQTQSAEGADRAARLALLAAGTAWAVHSLYDWDWEIPAVTLPALAAIAIAAAPFGPTLIRYRGEADDSEDADDSVERIGALPPARKPPLDARSPSAVPALLVAVLLAAALAVSAALPSLANDKVIAAQKKASDEDADEADVRAAIDDTESAHDLNPLSIEPLFTAAGLYGRLGEFDRSEELLLEAARLQPDNYRTWERLLLFAQVRGDVELQRIAVGEQLETAPLIFANVPTVASGSLFITTLPPDLSPTALGTPPRK